MHPGHAARCFSRPRQPPQTPQGSSPGLSLPTWASITCCGSASTFQNQWKGGALTWSLELPAFLASLKPDSCFSPASTLQKG